MEDPHPGDELYSTVQENGGRKIKNRRQNIRMFGFLMFQKGSHVLASLACNSGHMHEHT